MNILHLHNVSYRYDDSKKDVLKNLSVGFEKGKVMSRSLVDEVSVLKEEKGDR